MSNDQHQKRTALPEPKDLRIPQSDARDFSGPVTTVIVGEGKDELVVHKSILCASSLFFQNAAKPEWESLRADPKTINLSHIDLGLFKAYVHWLYTSTLPRQANHGHHWEDYPYLAKLYCLGEELMDVKFKNSILDTIIAISIKWSWNPVGETVSIIYNGTPETSPARRFMIDCCVNMAHKDPSWTEEFEKCPKEYLVEVMKLIVAKRAPTNEQPWKDHLSYHEIE